MKNTNTTIALISILATLGMQASQAATVTSVASGNWQGDEATVWDTGTRPQAIDTAVISVGDTVTNDGGAGFLSLNPSIINIDGAYNGAAVRVNTATINVSSTGTMGSGGFWDWDDGDGNFQDGATASMSTWEFKDLNTMTFTLNGSGEFTELTPSNGTIGIGGLSADWNNISWVIDLQNIGGGTYSTTLMDFGAWGGPVGDQDLTANLSFINTPSNFESISGASLNFFDTGDTIELSFQGVVAAPEPSTFGLLLIGAGMLASTRRRIARG